jgi:CBS domain-containing membrane protein
MLASRSLHPPSGGVALLAVLASQGWGFVLFPVLVNSLALVLAALAFHRLTGRRYPRRQTVVLPPPADGPKAVPPRFSPED